MSAVTAYYNEIAYLITNLVTGKQYVGITRTKLNRRWRGHVQAARKGVATAIAAAIRKYGENSFTIEQVASATSRENLQEIEKILILQFSTKSPHGYNLTDGGDGIIGLPEEIIKRTAERNRGRTHSPEARALIGAASAGHSVSEETRRAIGDARRGKPLSPEHRTKLSAAKTGRKLKARSAAHSAKIAQGLRRSWARRRGASV